MKILELFNGLFQRQSKQQQFKAFEKVLVRDNDDDVWYCAHFSHYYNGKDNDDNYRYKTTRGLGYKQCIHFNSKTKHLLGTTEKPKDN